jgi:hypothetical protein
VSSPAATGGFSPGTVVLGAWSTWNNGSTPPTHPGTVVPPSPHPGTVVPPPCSAPPPRPARPPFVRRPFRRSPHHGASGGLAGAFSSSGASSPLPMASLVWPTTPRRSGLGQAWYDSTASWEVGPRRSAILHSRSYLRKRDTQSHISAISDRKSLFIPDLTDLTSVKGSKRPCLKGFARSAIAPIIADPIADHRGPCGPKGGFQAN